MKNKQILKTLDNSFGLTFAELCRRLNSTKEDLRKNMNALHKDGRISRATDIDGIVHYTITDKGKSSLVVAVLAGAMIYGPQGDMTYIQDMGINGYNIYSSEGITQVRDFQGFEQVVAPDGSTTTIYDMGVAPFAPVAPVVPVIPLEIR